MNLFCLPYAGGSAAIYNNWGKRLNKNIEIQPIELPGRGKKHSLSLIDTISGNSSIIISEIQEKIMNSSYALFGHSMGAEIVYNMLQKIREKKLPEPKHVFFSGRKPPHLRTKKNYKNFSNEQLIDLLKEYGRTPDGFYENQDLISLYIPIIRNDFQMVDMLPIEQKAIEPFNINLTILIGEEESISIEEAIEWDKYTTEKCKIVKIPGGHFFIDDSKEKVIDTINKTLRTITIE